MRGGERALFDGREGLGGSPCKLVALSFGKREGSKEGSKEGILLLLRPVVLQKN